LVDGRADGKRSKTAFHAGAVLICRYSSWTELQLNVKDQHHSELIVRLANTRASLIIQGHLICRRRASRKRLGNNLHFYMLNRAWPFICQRYDQFWASQYIHECVIFLELTAEHIQLSDAVRSRVFAMSGTWWNQEYSNRIRAYDLLAKIWDRTTWVCVWLWVDEWGWECEGVGVDETKTYIHTYPSFGARS